MTINSTTTKKAPAGLTLLELTVVILAVLSLIGLTFHGAQAWKRGSDRAACVMNIYKTQQAVRCFAASHAYYPGQDVSSKLSEGTLLDEITGPGDYLEQEPVCPDDGGYTPGGNTIPRVGELFLTCSLAAEDSHKPEAHTDW